VCVCITYTCCASRYTQNPYWCGSAKRNGHYAEMPPAQGPLSPLGDQGAPYEGGSGLRIRVASSLAAVCPTDRLCRTSYAAGLRAIVTSLVTNPPRLSFFHYTPPLSANHLCVCVSRQLSTYAHTRRDATSHSYGDNGLFASSIVHRNDESAPPELEPSRLRR